MIGLGRMWKSVTGQDRGTGEPAQPRPSTIPRAIPAPRTAAPLPDLADVATSETRSAERFVPNRTATILTTHGGKRITGRIINISQTGVAVEAELADVNPLEIMTVGTRPVVPGRRITRGFVFLFKKTLDPKLCGPDMIL